MKNEIINQNVPQYGRSMIEMLGVLAIVGVLSVGGIAGYSKAMQKYRTNKTIDQITQLANGVRTLYGQQKNYANLSNYVIKKAKILPESVFENVDSDRQWAYGTNVFGGGLYVSYSSKVTEGDYKAFNIALHVIPEDACIEILMQDWGDTSGLIAYGLGANNSLLSNCNSLESYTQCVKDGPMPMDQVMNLCKKAYEKEMEIFFKFY